jgi:YidC/Oxa1 family membrane protein insertase
MLLFRENKINPLASCLPLVLQIPVFIALYYVLRSSFKAGSSFLDGSPLDFMWVIPNISKHLADIGAGAYILVAIYALSQLLSTEVSASPQMSPTQRKLMRFLPLLVVLFVFIYPVPSGLVIYWVTTNLWTCAQMLVIKRMIGLRPVVAAGPVAEGGPAPQRVGKSRTLPQSAPAVVPEPTEPAPAKTPRRRRGGASAPAGQADGNGAGDQPRRAPRRRPGAEPKQAPEPQAAPEPPPAPADGADGAGTPEAAPTAGGPGDGAPEQAPKGQRQGGDGGQRRQPRARGKGGGSSSGRRPPRKRR